MWEQANSTAEEPLLSDKTDTATQASTVKSPLPEIVPNLQLNITDNLPSQHRYESNCNRSTFPKSVTTEEVETSTTKNITDNFSNHQPLPFSVRHAVIATSPISNRTTSSSKRFQPVSPHPDDQVINSSSSGTTRQRFEHVTPYSKGITPTSFERTRSIGSWHALKLAASRHSSNDLTVSPSSINDINNNSHVVSDRPTPGGYIKSLHSRSMFVKPNGKYNMERRWKIGGRCRDLWFRDKFHFLLSMNMRILLPAMFFTYVVWAIFLSILLAIFSKFDVERCLGGIVSNYTNYYFFTVETMFAIGFGSPRYPSCTAANWMVTVIVVSTTLLNGFVLGLIFQKFSSATRRRWAVSFSGRLVGSCSPHIITKPKWTVDSHGDAVPYERFDKVSSTALPVLTNTELEEAQTPSKYEVMPKNTSLLPLDAASGSAMSDNNMNRNCSNSHLRVASTRHAYNSIGVTGHAELCLNSTNIYASRRWSSCGFFQEYAPVVTRRSESTGSGIDAKQTKALEQTQTTTHPLVPKVLFDNPENVEINGETTTFETADNVQTVSLDDQRESAFTLSFRLMNLSNQSFFKTRLALFLVVNGEDRIDISRINTFYTDVPLEFIELPTTVTIDSRDILWPITGCITPNVLIESESTFELVVLLSFTDNRTSRTMQIRKSWRLDETIWNAQYKDVVHRRRSGIYEVDVESLDKIEITSI